MKDPKDYGYGIGTAAEFIKACGSAFVNELVSRAGYIGQFVLWDEHSTVEDALLLTGPDRDEIIRVWNEIFVFPGKTFAFESQAHITH